MNNKRPQSELYRENALRHADLESAARMLEESKTAVFSQMVNAIMRDEGPTSVAKAELQTRGSAAWQGYIDRMVEARTLANKAKIEVEYQRMRFWEHSQDRADERYTARMS